MVHDNFDKYLAKEIILRLNNKGWNAYDSTNVRALSPQRVVNNGPADYESMSTNHKYVVLPVVEKPNDYEMVMSKLERISESLNGETPTIEINNVKKPWVGFRTFEKEVKVNTPYGDTLTYDQFLDSLITIYDVKRL